MSVLLDTNKIITNAVEVDQRIRLIFNDNLTKNQLKSGILAKCQITHPAFTTRVTVSKNEKGNLRVMAASLSTGEGEKDWFNIVLLEPGFRDYIVNEYKAFKEGKQAHAGEAWYLGAVGKHGPVPTSDKVNAELDLEDIIVTANLSDKQKETGMVCKVTIKTPVATLRGLSVYQSRFGQSVYLVAQTEDKDGQIPAYRFTHEAEVQILAYVHSLITEWGEAPAQKRKADQPDTEEFQAEDSAQGTFNEEEYFETAQGAQQ